MTSTYGHLSCPHIIQIEIPACKTKSGYFSAEQKHGPSTGWGDTGKLGGFDKRSGTTESLYKGTSEVRSLQYCSRVTPNETLRTTINTVKNNVGRAPVTV